MADGALDADERSRILHLLTDQLELAGFRCAERCLDEAIAAHEKRGSKFMALSSRSELIPKWKTVSSFWK